MTVPARRLATGLCAAALCLALTPGCSSSDGSASSDETSPSAQDLPQGQVDAVPALADGWDGIRDDVKVQDCPLEPGQVTAKGTVKNTAKQSRDVVIVIAWNAPDSTNPLLQLSTTKKDLGAGKTASWEVSGKLPAEAGQCVVLAKSGSLTKG